MSPSLIIIVLLSYFLIIGGISFFTSRFGNDNASFFIGGKKSPWYIVSVGMIGATLSGISIVSVPGMVRSLDFTYMQMVFGFFFGYIVVVSVLLPIYYRLNLTSIYGYLGNRFGLLTHRTGALFFILAKAVGGSARLYVVVVVLQEFVFNQLNIPFSVTIFLTLLVIYLYTYKGGIKTIVWTDFFQTIALLLAVILMIVEAIRLMDLNLISTVKVLAESSYSKIFVFDDWHSRSHFLKQFLSGIFVVVVMTGLDQDIMQKNLSCSTLKESRRNMLCYGFAFIPVNLLFLSLGGLLLLYASKNSIDLPLVNDSILPFFAMRLGPLVMICFVIGIVAAAFSSVDSALTSLTTSFMVDILKKDEKSEKRPRIIIHLLFTVLFFFLVLLFRIWNSQSAIDTIYTIVSYTYGPLLGLFAFGLFTSYSIREKWVPWIAISSPILSFILKVVFEREFGYVFGYELLILNGFFTFFGLRLVAKTPQRGKKSSLLK